MLWLKSASLHLTAQGIRQQKESPEERHEDGRKFAVKDLRKPLTNAECPRNIGTLSTLECPSLGGTFSLIVPQFLVLS